eukprot:gene7090-19520_t
MKLENLLLGTDGAVRITDFGLCNTQPATQQGGGRGGGGGTLLHSFVGTPNGGVG